MPPARESGTLTLAAIRKGKRETQYLFSEKQSILRVAVGGKAGRDTATLLREALLTADHNAYHLGQLVLLRRTLGAWNVAS